jgi:hypothetical protein
LKHTNSDHPDFQYLQTALEQVKEVAEFINESKRDQDTKSKFKEVQVDRLKHKASSTNRLC